MNLKQLSYFVTVVESGSISKAAKKLHMSQPPLSRHMHLLEEDLNVKLFQRQTNSLKLTQEGEELYKRAYDLLELASKTEKAILELNKNEYKTLEIGMVSSSINYLLDKPIYDYLNKNKLKLSIHEGNTYELLEQLNHHIIDLAICRTPFSYNLYEHKKLCDEEMILVSKSKLKNSYSISDLDNAPMIIYRRFKTIIQTLFNEKNASLNIMIEVDDAKSAILWANTNIGIAIVPKSIFKALNTNLYSAHLNEEALDTSLMVILRKNEKEKEILDFKNFL